MTKQSFVHKLRQKTVWQPVLIALLSLFAYSNTFPGNFIWDDNTIVKNNPIIVQLDLVKIFGADYWGSGLSDLYRPITMLSLAINRWVFGDAAFAFHIVNVVLHVCVSLLVWAMLKRWAFPEGVAVLAGGFFAVHPIHGEVVNVIVGRSELLAALFLLLGLIVVRNAGWRSTLLTCMFFLLAMLSKEHAIIFLPTLFIMDLFRRENAAIRSQRSALYSGLIIIVFAWFCWRTWGLPRLIDTFPVHPDMAPLHALPWGQRMLSAIQTQWLYLWKLILPTGLQGAYSGPRFLDAIMFTWSWRGMLSIIGTLLLLVAVFVGWRSKATLALVAVLYLISVTPTSNIFFPIGTSFAERLTYFPSIWFCTGIAVITCRTVDWRGKKLNGYWLGGIYLAILMVLCLLRNQAYATPEKYWQTDIIADSENFMAWFNLADVLSHAEGRQADAENAFQSLFARRPDFIPAWRLYANFLYRNAKYPEALIAAKKAGLDPNDIQSQLLLAEVYFKLRDYHASLVWLDQVSPLVKDTTRYWDVLGRNLKALGRHAEAVDAFYKVTVVPAGSDLPLELAYSLVYLNRYEEAVPVLKYALAEGMGERAKVLNTLGTVMAQLGQINEAAKLFEQAVQENPDNQLYKENLGRAKDAIYR